MIIIIAKKTMKQECVAEFEQLAKELVEESNKEEGCIEYHLYQDLEYPNRYTYIEKWKDQEAIDAHNQSKHYTSIVPKMAELAEGPTEVSFHKIVY